jgi:hypothetical protein
MAIQFVLLPIFVQVLLTFGVGFVMGARRQRAFKSGLRLREIAVDKTKYPEDALNAQYSYSNQFEMPVLFYVVMILAIITRHADIVMVALAWIFVVFRFLQAYVHVTSNNVRYRGGWFFVSTLALAIMWIWFAVRILTGLP